MIHNKRTISDEQFDLVWEAFKKGKKWAFSKIYEDNYDDLYNYGVKFISDHEITKDLIHDLFIKLWNFRSHISKPINIKAYLLKSIRSIILDYIKVYKRKFKETELHNNIPFITLSPEEEYISEQSSADNLQKIQEELNKLPDRQKEAIYLHYIKEYPYKEVAEIMGLRIQSIRNLVHEGLIKLKQRKKNFL